MTAALDKEDRDVAIEKHISRKSMVTAEVPPTTSGKLFVLFSKSFITLLLIYFFQSHPVTRIYDHVIKKAPCSPALPSLENTIDTLNGSRF